jgi:isopenicillin N synthase-like dioxygenase
MSTHSIPVVDLSQFTAGDDRSKFQFVEELGKAFEDVGFVSVKNHGVSQELVDDYYAAIKNFFALPTEVKKKYEIAGLAGQRGYTSFGKEQAKGFDTPDLQGVLADGTDRRRRRPDQRTIS